MSDRTHTLDDLHDAFDTLERRADAAPATELRVAAPHTTHSRMRVLAPAGGVAVVAAAAVSIAVWQHSPSGGTQQAGGSVASSASPTASSRTHPASTHSSAAPRVPSYQPPKTPAALAAKTRSILAGVAFINVTDSQIEPGQSYIVGTLTVKKEPLDALAQSGGFDVQAVATPPGSKAECEVDFHCTFTKLSDGTSIGVGHFRAGPGAVTYEVNAVNPDGSNIQIRLGTQADPKNPGSPVTASHLPLTVKQLTAFATSDKW